MNNDSNNLGDIYKKILTEIRSNVPSGDGDPRKVGHRIKGRHIIPAEPKPEIPASRKEYPQNSQEPTDYSSDSEYDIYGKDDEVEYVTPPPLKDLESMPNDERKQLKFARAFIRTQIDELTKKSEKIKGLAINRNLMDSVIDDLVLGFAVNSDVRITGITEDDDPIFTIGDGKEIIVQIPYGEKSNHEDVKYIKI